MSGRTGKESRKKAAVHILIVVAASLALACLTELVLNFRILSLDKRERGVHEIPVHEVYSEGFRQENETLIFESDPGIIRINMGGRYVDKLKYTFEYEGLLNLDVFINAYNIYGEADEEERVFVPVRESKLVKEGYLNIGKRTDYVELVVHRYNLEEPGLSYINFADYPLKLTGFTVKNQPVWHGFRMCFFWCLFGLGAMLWLGREWMAVRIETGFLIIALSAGTLMILSMPANKVGWDEEVHFADAFWLSSYPARSMISDEVMQQFSAGIDTWPYNQPDTIEEQKLLNQYLDDTGNYRNGKNSWSLETNKTTFQGYAGSAVMLRLGRLLHLPFSDLMRFGRWGNLLVYSILMFFAIRTVPIGKGMMAFIGLMPTPMFLASVYSYDPMVTACLYLAFAVMLKYILNEDSKINWKEYCLFLLVFVIGCRTKAVYAPLLLIGLLIPPNRFENEKQRRIMRTGIVLTSVILLASFLLPVLISPSETGDLRGGATSEAGQMAYVLGKPFAYMMVLLKNIWRTAADYLAGVSVFGSFGYLGTVKTEWIFYVGAAFVVLTDNRGSVRTWLSGKQKFWIFLLTAGAVVLIWTSMYMAFTEPGKEYIGGVQGRYYIPLLFLVYLLFRCKRVELQIEKGTYYRLVLACSGGILLYSIYQTVFIPYCL